MRLFGWKEVFDPEVIAWHDRQTTKTLKKSPADFIRLRRAVPMKKRRLDWRNTRWTIIKNIIYHIRKISRPYSIGKFRWRIYIFFEPAVLLEIPKFIILLPKIY